MIKILIIGLGTIGFRHFESIFNSNKNYHIDCYDNSTKSLKKINKFLSKNTFSHKIKLLKNINDVESKYDFLIHATSSNVRLVTLQNVLRKSKIRYGILEKFLAQSDQDLEKFKLVIDLFEKCWVNTPMHEWSLYKKLKKKVSVDNIKKIEFNYFEGLACNSIHFLDFVSSWKKKLPSKIKTSKLKNWYLSKRKGFYDVYGELEIIYLDGTRLILKSEKNKTNYHCRIKEQKRAWTLIEKDQTFYSSDGIKDFGIVEYQSELTNKIIQKILKKGSCELPDIHWSIKCHKILINSMLNYWNQYNKVNIKKLPVT